MQTLTIITRDNNFDLVRLFAALQVVFFHIQDRLDIVLPGMDWLRNFKGVPIFFTVSGFLITASYVRNKDVKHYFINRGLRIYPAIYVLIIVTTLAALACGDIGIGNLFTIDYERWILAWITIDQNYTPPILYGFGIGTPNGSLWTIPVELTFYLFIPLLFKIMSRKRLFGVMFFLSFISIVSNYFYHDFQTQHPVAWMYTFSLVPYLYWFLMGAAMYLCWDKLKPYIENKFPFYFGLLLILIVCDFFLPSSGTHTAMKVHNPIELLMNILLSVTTISAAFSFRSASKVLHGKDLSYGIYLYHGLVINIMIELCNYRTWAMYLIIYVFTIVCAWFSWHYVEKPCLALKKLLH